MTDSWYWLNSLISLGTFVKYWTITHGQVHTHTHTHTGRYVNLKIIDRGSTFVSELPTDIMERLLEHINEEQFLGQ